jgi:hypothetical protein
MQTLKKFKNNSDFLKNLGISYDSLQTNLKMNVKQIKHYLHLGGQNYANLKEKIPILGGNGKPLKFKIGGKTIMEMYEPHFKDGYTPVAGTEKMFFRPKFMQNQQKNKTNKKQKGGIGAIGILSWIGIILYAVLQIASQSGSDK